MKNNYRAFALIAIATCVGSPAWSSQSSQLPLDVAPFYGVRFGGRIVDETTGASLHINSKPAYGATASFALPSQWDRLELLYSRQESALSDRLAGQEVNVDTDYWQLGINRRFPSDDERIQPFLVGLLGGTFMDFSSGIGHTQMFSVGMGGGVKYFFKPNMGLRLDARVYLSFIEGSGSIACSGGCVAHFQGSTFTQAEIAPSFFWML